MMRNHENNKEGNDMIIGFIGLGIMGKPMAKNLLKAGYSLCVYDIVASNIDVLEKCGARPCKCIRDVADTSDIIITMLPNSPQVEEVVLGDNGILSGNVEGKILVDMSSINPTSSKKLYKRCIDKKMSMIDAPVSGGEPKAIDGTLSIMCGGMHDVFEQIKPILMAMGKDVTYCGDIGAGNTTKLANQIIVAGNIALVAEAFTFAKKAGVEPEVVFNAIKGGLAGSTVMNAKVPMMIKDDFKPGFRIDLHIKDLDNAIQTAHTVGAPVPLTSILMEFLENLHFDGKGNLDHSALACYYEKLSGVSISSK